MKFLATTPEGELRRTSGSSGRSVPHQREPFHAAHCGPCRPVAGLGLAQ
jgi:hypothetical protein